MRKRIRAIDYLVYVLVRIGWTVFSMFSIEANLHTMRLLGRFWFYVPHALPAGIPFIRRLREHRNRAERHVRMAFPQASDAEVERIVRGSFESLAMLAVEVLLTPRLITQWSWARHIQLRKLDEAIRALASPRGCIMLTGHYGSWELLGYTLAILGFDIVAVMRPLDNEYLNRFLLDRRERSGLSLLYKKGATRNAPEVLESGGALCFIADQNAGRKGQFVDFFGYKASTYKAIGLLAIHHDVPIVVGCARRCSRGFDYEICVNRVIYPEEWKDKDDELAWTTQEYTRALEDLIRVAPEQYLWMHRRWKSRPRGERPEDAPPI